LTFCADRDKYCCRIDDLFVHQPNIVKLICVKAIELWAVFLDGFILTLSNPTKFNVAHARHLLANVGGIFSEALKLHEGDIRALGVLQILGPCIPSQCQSTRFCALAELLTLGSSGQQRTKKATI